MWEFVLADASNGGFISDLPGVGGKTFTQALSSIATGSITVRGDRDEADAIRAGDETLLQVWSVDDDTGAKTLRAHLHQVATDEVGSATGIALTASYADPAWFLQRRITRFTLDPGLMPVAPYRIGSALAPVDRGAIIADLVNLEVAASPAWIRMGNVTASSKTYVDGWWGKPILEAIAELSATLDGPDWIVRPIEYVPITEGGNDDRAVILGTDSGPFPPVARGFIGELDISPAIGGLNENAEFGYGPGTMANVTGYRRGITLDGSLSSIWGTPAGFPDNATQPLIPVNDAAAMAKWGQMIAMQSTDLTVDQLRRELLLQQIAVRKTVRQTITFDAGSDRLAVPQLGVDYDIGDVVTFRVASERATNDGVGEIVRHVDGLFRIYQASITVDELGTATTALTVTPGG